MSRSKREDPDQANGEEEVESAAATGGDAPPEGSADSESGEAGLELREESAETGTGTEVEALRREAQEMRDLAQRKQAEFENYRRRVERERAELSRHAGFDLVREILPVLDNLERAIQASQSSPEENFRAGVEIIHRQFQEILARLGLSEVESEGKPFDPHVHEAVTRVETDEHPEGVVVEVLQKGYLFGDRLVRPAMVSVAQAPDGEEVVPGDAPENPEEVAQGPE
jgi:molecular chaperone GrpE